MWQIELMEKYLVESRVSDFGPFKEGPRLGRPIIELIDRLQREVGDDVEMTLELSSWDQEKDNRILFRLKRSDEMKVFGMTDVEVFDPSLIRKLLMEGQRVTMKHQTEVVQRLFTMFSELAAAAVEEKPVLAGRNWDLIASDDISSDFSTEFHIDDSDKDFDSPDLLEVHFVFGPGKAHFQYVQGSYLVAFDKNAETIANPEVIDEQEIVSLPYWHFLGQHAATIHRRGPYEVPGHRFFFTFTDY